MMIKPRIWRGKKKKLLQELDELARKSPILKILGIQDHPDELQALLCLEVPTLIEPELDRVRTAGPTVLQLRYNESFATIPPLPYEIVHIVYPAGAFHPNQRPTPVGGSGLCLGDPRAGMSMEAILSLTYAAITLNSYETSEWLGLNPVAADFVRRHADEFPLVPTGLLEAPPRGLHIPFEEHAMEVLSTLTEIGARP